MKHILCMYECVLQIHFHFCAWKKMCRLCFDKVDPCLWTGLPFSHVCFSGWNTSLALTLLVIRHSTQLLVKLNFNLLEIFFCFVLPFLIFFFFFYFRKIHLCIRCKYKVRKFPYLEYMHHFWFRKYSHLGTIAAKDHSQCLTVPVLLIIGFSFFRPIRTFWVAVYILNSDVPK